MTKYFDLSFEKRRDLHTTRFHEYMAKATTRLNQGFSSKAGKKEANEQVGHAFDEAKECLMQSINMLGDIPKDERSSLFFSMPSHARFWKESHSEFYSRFPDSVEMFLETKELYEQIKATELVPIAKKDKSIEIVSRAVEESLKERMERYGEMKSNGVEMAEIFGKLNVRVDWHYVENAHGTVFTRQWFYLNYQRTPLSVIVAVLQDCEDKGILKPFLKKEGDPKEVQEAEESTSPSGPRR